MSVGYIPSSEYEAWARLNRVKISPAELATLKRMDRLTVSHYAKKVSPESAAAPQISSRQMTPDLFDALWGVPA